MNEERRSDPPYLGTKERLGLRKTRKKWKKKKNEKKDTCNYFFDLFL